MKQNLTFDVAKELRHTHKKKQITIFALFLFKTKQKHIYNWEILLGIYFRTIVDTLLTFWLQKLCERQNKNQNNQIQHSHLFKIQYK